jgi:hypothetical protein
LIFSKVEKIEIIKEKIRGEGAKVFYARRSDDNKPTNKGGKTMKFLSKVEILCSIGLIVFFFPPIGKYWRVYKYSRISDP